MGFITNILQKTNDEIKARNKILTDRVKIQSENLKLQKEKLNLDKDLAMIQAFKLYNQHKETRPIQKSFLRKLSEMFRKPQDFLVRMELRNKEYASFIVNIDKPYFIYENSAYIIDSNFMEWDITHRMYWSFYHQDIAFPIKINVDVNTMKKELMKNEKLKEIYLTANPFTLLTYIKSEFIEKTARGGDLEKDIGFIKMMIIILIIAQVVSMILIYKK